MDDHDAHCAWQEKRRLRIGSSEVAIVLGISPYKGSSRLALFLKKTGQAPDRVEGEFLKRGRQLQPTIALMYEDETGRETRDLGEYTIQLNPDYPFLHATLDVEILPNGDHDTPGIGEVKNVGEWMGKDWADGMPEYVNAQMQAQLLVIGHTWGSVMVLIGGNRFLQCDVYPDPELQARIIEQCRDFWDCVESETPPVAGADDHAALAAMYPAHDPGKSIALDGCFVDFADLIDNAKGEIDRHVDLVSGAQAKFKQAMEDAETGVMPNGRQVRWKRNKAGNRVFLLGKVK